MSEPAENPGYFDRLRSHICLKLLLAIVLNICTWVPYQLLQHYHLYPSLPAPVTALDQAIPFWPASTWIYLSVYGLTLLAPLFLYKKSDLLRYAAGILIISLTADLIFLLWPTTCARPPWQGGSFAYDLLIKMDSPLHAFPSLHAAFCLYSAFWAGRTLRERSAPTWSFALLWLWTFAVFFATLTTKQHVIADLGAGSLLAWGVYAGFRGRPVKTGSQDPTKPSDSA